MTDVVTEKLSIGITTDVADMLHAFAVARNGQVANCANECLRKGIQTIVDSTPGYTGFAQRYKEALKAKVRK
jgi:hypothetical protein